MSDMRISWEKLQNRYASENLKYRKAVRNLLSERLGFEPDLRSSIDAELFLRSSFKKHDEGILSKETLEQNIERMIRVVGGLIKDKGF